MKLSNVSLRHPILLGGQTIIQSRCLPTPTRRRRCRRRQRQPTTIITNDSIRCRPRHLECILILRISFPYFLLERYSVHLPFFMNDISSRYFLLFCDLCIKVLSGFVFS